MPLTSEGMYRRNSETGEYEPFLIRTRQKERVVVLAVKPAGYEGFRGIVIEFEGARPSIELDMAEAGKLAVLLHAIAFDEMPQVFPEKANVIVDVEQAKPEPRGWMRALESKTRAEEMPEVADGLRVPRSLVCGYCGGKFLLFSEHVPLFPMCAECRAVAHEARK